MILIFSVKDYPQIWKVGDKPLAKARDILEIRLDGEELQLVKKHLSRIPFSKNSIEHYFGDMAKYVAKAIGAAI